MSLCCKFPTESNSERILKIGKYLVKLWARVRCLVFLTHSVDRECTSAPPGEYGGLIYVAVAVQSDATITVATYNSDMGGNVTSGVSAGWQVTPDDPTMSRHVRSGSGEVCC